MATEPLSPDVAELVRRVRASNRDLVGSGYEQAIDATRLATECERLDDFNTELQREIVEYKLSCERLAVENARLREMLNLVNSIHAMTDGQLKKLIASCQAARDVVGS